MHVLFCYRRLLVLAQRQLEAVSVQDMDLLESLASEREVLTLSVREQLKSSGKLTPSMRAAVDDLLRQTLDVDASIKRRLIDLLRTETDRLDRLQIP